MKNNILIIVAHPDDAEFGMGGTISKLSKDNNITLCVLCRGNRPGGSSNVEDIRKKVLNENIKSLGISKLIQYVYDDVSLDKHSHLSITNYISSVMVKIQPDIIYTNYSGDLHIDHQLVSKAVRVACRPRRNCSVKTLYEFSIPGSGEWNFKGIDYNTFYNIEKYIKIKYDCIDKYTTELQPVPDPLSSEYIKYRDLYYGSISGYKQAEPFICIFNRL
jgi:LmbE family N-acetylglucosaminyl deacetylase